MRFSVLLARLFVHCVLACTSPVAVHPQSSLSAGYEPAAIAEIVRQARIGVPRRATESVSAGAWAISFDAEILVQETPLVHFADAITPITKSPRLPSADGRLVIHLNASLCSTTRCNDDFYALRSRERLCPLYRTGLCRIVDMDFPELDTSRQSGDRPFLDTPVNDLFLGRALVTLVVVLRFRCEPSYGYAVFP
jgi:hypothetical protein